MSDIPAHLRMTVDRIRVHLGRPVRGWLREALVHPMHGSELALALAAAGDPANNESAETLLEAFIALRWLQVAQENCPTPSQRATTIRDSAWGYNAMKTLRRWSVLKPGPEAAEGKSALRGGPSKTEAMTTFDPNYLRSTFADGFVDTYLLERGEHEIRWWLGTLCDAGLHHGWELLVGLLRADIDPPVHESRIERLLQYFVAIDMIRPAIWRPVPASLRPRATCYGAEHALPSDWTFAPCYASVALQGWFKGAA